MFLAWELSSPYSGGSSVWWNQNAAEISRSAFFADAPEVVETVQDGGPGRGRRVYVERDGEILIFQSASQAAIYIGSEKREEIPDQVAIPRPKQKPKPAPVPEIIKIDILAMLMHRYGLKSDISTLVSNHEHEAIYALHMKMLQKQDDEDVELLLMVA